MTLLSRFSVFACSMTLATSVLPSVASARIVSPRVTPKADLSVVTNAEYLHRKLYLQGTWKVTATGSGITFSRTGAMVQIDTIPREKCTYQAIRTRAQKAWGGTLKSSTSRIENLVLGRSAYKGFSWLEPRSNHWCMLQDAKTAFHLSAVDADTNLLTFLSTNFVLQLAVRKAVR